MPFSVVKSNMIQQTTTNDLMKVLEPLFGGVNELCRTISNAALELAVTQPADYTDYKHIQDAVSVMLELKKAFETLEPQR